MGANYPAASNSLKPNWINIVSPEGFTPHHLLLPCAGYSLHSSPNQTPSLWDAHGNLGCSWVPPSVTVSIISALFRFLPPPPQGHSRIPVGDDRVCNPYLLFKVLLKVWNCKMHLLRTRFHTCRPQGVNFLMSLLVLVWCWCPRPWCCSPKDNRSCSDQGICHRQTQPGERMRFWDHRKCR